MHVQHHECEEVEMTYIQERAWDLNSQVAICMYNRLIVDR